MTAQRITSTLLAATVAVALAACGSSASSHSSSAHSQGSTMPMPAAKTKSAGASKVLAGQHVQIAIASYAFSPPDFTVKAGTQVTFTNHDQTAHTATADGGAFDTGTVNPGQSKMITLKKPGTYPYHCAFHAFMKGTITVTS